MASSSDLPPPSGEALAGGNELLGVIEQSKINLAAEDQATLKRKPGRPPLPKKEDPKVETPPPALEPEFSAPEIDIKPFLKLIIETPFKVQARKRRFPQYALEPEESEGLTETWNECLKPFSGVVVNSKWGALAMCAISTALVIAGKEMQYGEFIEGKRAEILAKEVPDATPTMGKRTEPTSVSRDPDLDMPPVNSGGPGGFFPAQ